MARFPRATWRPVANHSSDGMGTIRLCVLHIMQGTLEGTYNWFNDPNAEASSHFGTGKDGTLDQFVDTADKAWAQATFNPVAISIENEGYSGQPLTDHQVEQCAHVLAWAYREHNVPLLVTDDPNGSGLITHGDLGTAGGGHYNCPGAPVAAQRPEIVARAGQIIGQLRNTPSPSVEVPWDMPANWITISGQSVGADGTGSTLIHADPNKVVAVRILNKDALRTNPVPRMPRDNGWSADPQGTVVDWVDGEANVRFDVQALILS